MPTVMPVKGSWSDSGGGEVEVAMEPGDSDTAGGRVSIPCISIAEAECVAFVHAERSRWGGRIDLREPHRKAAVKTPFYGSSDVGAVAVAWASMIAAGARSGRVMVRG